MKKILILLLALALSLTLSGCFKDWGEGNTVTVNGETVYDSTK